MSQDSVEHAAPVSSIVGDTLKSRAQIIGDLLLGIHPYIIDYVKTANLDALEIPSGCGLMIPASTVNSPNFSASENQLRHPEDLCKLGQITSLSLDEPDDNICPQHSTSPAELRSALVELYTPSELLAKSCIPCLPEQGVGPDGLLQVCRSILAYSVNTFAQGFMDKLYASPDPPGLLSELILGALNTNVHVAHVSPVLTLVERLVTRKLCALLGWHPTLPSKSACEKPPFFYAGGVLQPGGSACNQLAIMIARAHLYPESRVNGNNDRQFALFTSCHGHYSIEKAAIMLGMGLRAVRKVPVDENGCMIPQALQESIQTARNDGLTPLFVNITAGTTVLGSYDPIQQLSEIAHRENLWCHVDASWGGGVIVSEKLRESRLGHLDNSFVHSLTVCAHKMLGTPVTCSFLLCHDMRYVKQGISLEAGYLFHDSSTGTKLNTDDLTGNEDPLFSTPGFTDLADLTPQCGRRGDALKLYMSWMYYGTQTHAQLIEEAFCTAQFFVDLLRNNSDEFLVVSPNPLPNLQVCFYWIGYNKVLKRPIDQFNLDGPSVSIKPSVLLTLSSRISKRLTKRGFMVDFAPALGSPNGVESQSKGRIDERGPFLRVVVNRFTLRSTVVGLARAIVKEGRQIIKEVSLV